jgi:hypothetical protein
VDESRSTKPEREKDGFSNLMIPVRRRTAAEKREKKPMVMRYDSGLGAERNRRTRGTSESSHGYR